jgi:hypothetical protein
MDNNEQKINYRSIKKNALKRPVHVGEVYGVYEVVEEVLIPTEKCVRVKYKCRNINTGKEFLYGAAYIHRLGERTREKFEKLNQYGLRNYLYRANRRNARNRHHGFYLTFDEYNNIISQPCYYCGDEPKEATKELIVKRGDTHQPTIRYNGVDRIDPLGDYTIDNCVPCCSICNYMKHVLTKDAFFEQIKKIYNHSIKDSINSDSSENPITNEVNTEEDTQILTN